MIGSTFWYRGLSFWLEDKLSRLIQAITYGFVFAYNLFTKIGTKNKGDKDE